MDDIILKRKSIRKYDMTPLDNITLQQISAQIEKVRPLYDAIDISIEFTTKTKGLFGIKAPHYLIFGSEKKEGYLENIGFIGQQLDLYFSKNGFGACWLGASKPEEEMDAKKPYVIAMSFGKPNEPLYRDLSGFHRKHLSEICEGVDERIEAARLAPSGINSQNWYFIADNGKIHCYRKKVNLLMSFILTNLNQIDMGIALYHIALESENFTFKKQENPPIRNGYIYMGTVG